MIEVKKKDLIDFCTSSTDVNPDLTEDEVYADYKEFGGKLSKEVYLQLLLFEKQEQIEILAHGATEDLYNCGYYELLDTCEIAADYGHTGMGVISIDLDGNGYLVVAYDPEEIEIKEDEDDD